MKVDAFSSLSHYSDHIRPIWEALPPSVRGQWWTPVNLPRSERLTIVASYRDAQTIGRPYVLVEHGAGQGYQGITNGSYSGGEGHDRCVLFLCPSERVAMRWRERYDVPAIPVGCPRLDRYSGSTPKRAMTGDAPSESGQRVKGGRSRWTAGTGSTGGHPTVAVSFHWDCALIPETHSAWRYYDPHLPRLVRDPRFRVVGHGHPRLWSTIRRRWAELGVDQWPDVDRVLSEADAVVMDNSSLGYEAAAVGIPVICLNMPSYRREVEHGGRFWSAPPGIQVDHPSELADAIACALTDPPAHRAIRARAVEWAYGGPITGDASERAANAILEVLNGK